MNQQNNSNTNVEININLYRLERLIEKAYQQMQKRQTARSMARHYALIRRLEVEVANGIS